MDRSSPAHPPATAAAGALPLSYAAALDYLASFANFEHRPLTAHTGFKLERMHALCAYLGRPEQRFPSVQIAGTKGKGSTAAMLEGILRAAGYRTGLYTSPHLHVFRERIRVAGRCISEEDLAAAVATVRPAAERLQCEQPALGALTMFELTTAAAFVHFDQAGVQCAVLETGLGGRLDAVTVVQPVATVMTSISLDHTAVLGATLPAIASEKAGIVKPGVPLVSAPQHPEALAVVERVCRERDAPLWLLGREVRWHVQQAGRRWRIALQTPVARHDGLRVPLAGRHQCENAALAVATADLLCQHGFAIPPRAIRQGLALVRWPGRLEVLRRRPWLVVDGAHNADSAAKLAEALIDLFPAPRRVLIVGASRDKDIAGIVRALAPAATHVIATASTHPRAAGASEVAAIAAAAGLPTTVAGDVPEALSLARRLTRGCDLICATGSLFVVAEVRAALGLAAEDC